MTQKHKEQDYTRAYGKGFKLIQKLGMKNVSKGLGKNESGVT